MAPHMTTTTIRLSEDLKARVQKLAQARGLTPHALILEAIAEKADGAERRAEFQDLADDRFARLLESGETIPWKDMRRYLKALAQGEAARPPAVRKRARA